MLTMCTTTQGALAWLDHCDLLRDYKSSQSVDSAEMEEFEQENETEPVKPLSAGEEVNYSSCSQNLDYELIYFS